MPRQLRSNAQTDAWKRQIPADTVSSLIYCEKVALKAGGADSRLFSRPFFFHFDLSTFFQLSSYSRPSASPRAPAFALFVITPYELLSVDTRGGGTVARYPFKHVLSVERASSADVLRLFDDADVQADATKYSIRVSAEQASVPETTVFYSYFHDSHVFFHLRQAWMHSTMQRYVGEPLFATSAASLSSSSSSSSSSSPSAEGTSIAAASHAPTSLPLDGVRIDQIKSIFVDIEKQFLIAQHDLKARTALLEELTVCVSSHTHFKALVLGSANFSTLLKRLLHDLCEQEKLSVDELSLCSAILGVFTHALAGSESLIAERNAFCARIQIESLFELAFVATPPAAFPDLAAFVARANTDSDTVADHATQAASFEKLVQNLAFEFDIRQAMCIAQLVPLLEHAWLSAIDNPDRDRIFGFEDCFRAFVLKRHDDRTFARLRAPRIFARVIELLKILESGQPVPDEEAHSASEETTLRIAGVEDPVIKANVLRLKAAERARLREQQLAPQETKRVCFYIHEVVAVRFSCFPSLSRSCARSNVADICASVCATANLHSRHRHGVSLTQVFQRLLSFPAVRNSVARENSVDLRHHLSKHADDALLERIRVHDPLFEAAARDLVLLVDELLQV